MPRPDSAPRGNDPQRLRPQEAFGKAVRLRRHELELSQEELGAQCGLDRTYISGIERGERNPTLQTIWRVAGGLQISPSGLLERAERRIERAEKEKDQTDSKTDRT
jgi:transcriptional regulator with XRE-family HTH domain